MNNHRTLWTLAALWDFLRVGVLFLFYTVNDGILQPYNALVLSSLLGPLFVFPFWALMNILNSGSLSLSVGPEQPWKTGKILSLGALGFLLLFLSLAFYSGRGAIPNPPEIVQLYSLGGLVIGGDLGVLGLVHFLMGPRIHRELENE